MSNKQGSKKRGSNPAFTALINIRKHVATKLGIPNSAKAAKVAGAALKAVRKEDMSMDAMVKAGIAEFDSNMSKYEKLSK
jgi:hypothetical protein